MADDKKYYYLRLKENFFASDAVQVLESMPDGYLYSNILLKLYLKSLKFEGKLMFNERIPYNPTVLATLTGHQVGTVEKALEMFLNLDLIEMLDNGAIYMLDIQSLIGKSSTEADRKREYRAKIEKEKELLGQMSGQISDESTPEIESRDKSLESRDRDRDKSQSINKESHHDNVLPHDIERDNIKKNSIKKSPAKAKSTRPKDAELLEWIAEYPLEFQEAFMEWAAMRKMIHKPIPGKTTVTRTLNELERLTKHISNSDRKLKTKIEILNQSTDNNWQGIFPLRAKQESQPEPKIYNFSPEDFNTVDAED